MSASWYQQVGSVRIVFGDETSTRLPVYRDRWKDMFVLYEDYVHFLRSDMSVDSLYNTRWGGLALFTGFYTQSTTSSYMHCVCLADAVKARLGVGT
jgi:hypothetical protein